MITSHAHDWSELALAARVAALFERELQFAPVATDTDLFETSVLDSLSFVTLLAALEDEFEVRIAVESLDLRHFASIDAIARFVASCQDPHHAPACRTDD